MKNADNALDGEGLEAGVTVDVDIGAVVIESRDHEDESQKENESTDDRRQQEYLLEAVVRSKPLDHGRSPPPVVLLVVPAVETIAGNSTPREKRKLLTASPPMKSFW